MFGHSFSLDEETKGSFLEQWSADGNLDWSVDYPSDNMLDLAVTSADRILVLGGGLGTSWLAMNEDDQELWRIAQDEPANVGAAACG